MSFGTLSRRLRKLLSGGLVLAMLAAALVMPPLSHASTGTPDDLIISEYIEGSSHNKALELYNPTDAPIDLEAGGYRVQMYFNGSSSAGRTINLAGVVPAGGTFVLGNGNAEPGVTDRSDQLDNSTSWYNGDDAVVLRKGADEVVDSLGQVGVDPGSSWQGGGISTQDRTLRRMGSVLAGDTNPTDPFDPSVEWEGFPQNTFDGLGSHGDASPPDDPPIEVKAIGEVQGAVGPDDDGLASASPYVGDEVVIRGVVTQKILSRSSNGSQNNGIFLQEQADLTDDDPYTSDGIFVFMGRYNDFRQDGGGYYLPEVGDELILRGRVTEYFGLTQLSSATLLSVVQTGLAVDAVVPAFEANPPDDPEEAARYWERREGMRATVPAGAIALGPRLEFSSTADAEIRVVSPLHPVAQREDPYARRSFRDAHPLDNVPAQLFDDGNPYRIILGSLGVKGSTGDSMAMIQNARTFDTLAAPATGGVYYAFGKYQVQVAEQLDWTEGVDPSLNGPPEPAIRTREFSVAIYNVENLYDFRNDPFDGCDFHYDSGCPGVNPDSEGRYNYVPDSEAEYQAKLQQQAQQIVEDLHGPDLLLVQEAEDQDICTVDGLALLCGDENNADGKPDTLQELALAIAAWGGPAYDAAYDRDGSDDRGIVSAFLFRTDRVELLEAMAADPVLGSQPTVQYPAAGLAYNADVQNPKVLNAVLPDYVTGSTDGDNVFTRAPQVALFRVWRGGVGSGLYADLYAVSNHFSSGPDNRVAQRREQAAYNAAIVAALQAADPDALVLTGGDLNVYPRPDDPYANPTDQLGPLYDQGLENLYDTLLAEVPSSAYSYVYDHQAQTLDQIFVTPSLHGALAEVRVAHINSDWPAESGTNEARGASDHDPQVARFSLLPSLTGLKALVDHYEAEGLYKNDQVAEILMDRLDRAAEFRARGQTKAAEQMIESFINQVRGFQPKQIADQAADSLAQEAEALLESGW